MSSIYSSPFPNLQAQAQRRFDLDRPFFKACIRKEEGLRIKVIVIQKLCLARFFRCILQFTSNMVIVRLCKTSTINVGSTHACHVSLRSGKGLTWIITSNCSTPPSQPNDVSNLGPSLSSTTKSGGWYRSTEGFLAQQHRFHRSVSFAKAIPSRPPRRGTGCKGLARNSSDSSSFALVPRRAHEGKRSFPFLDGRPRFFQGGISVGFDPCRTLPVPFAFLLEGDSNPKPYGFGIPNSWAWTTGSKGTVGPFGGWSGHPARTSRTGRCRTACGLFAFVSTHRPRERGMEARAAVGTKASFRHGKGSAPRGRRATHVVRAEVEVEKKSQSLEIMRRFSEQYAKRSGTYFCVDKGVTSVVIKGLADHKDELGAPLCPCRHYDDKEAEVASGYWNCPCVPMRERKECHCMLFLTEDNDFVGKDQDITLDEIVESTQGM